MGCGDLPSLIRPPGAWARPQALVDLVVAPWRPAPPSVAPARVLDDHALALAALCLPGVRQHKIGLSNTPRQRQSDDEGSNHHVRQPCFGRSFKFEPRLELIEPVDVRLSLCDAFSSMSRTELQQHIDTSSSPWLRSHNFFATLAAESAKPSFGFQQREWVRALLVRAHEAGLYDLTEVAHG